jgi:hypothetical protein
LNSWVADCATVVESLADVSTEPAAVKNHWTLLRIQLVRASNTSPSVAFARNVVTQLAGLRKQRR